MRKVIKKNNYLFGAGVALAVLLAIVGIAGIAKAFDFWGEAAKQAGNRAYEDNKPALTFAVSNDSFGAASAYGYCSGDESIIQIGCNARVQYFTTETLTASGVVTLSATTTLPVNTYYGSRIAITQVATTTYANPAPMAYYCNTGADLLVTNWWIDVKTNNGLWGSSWTAGTTTCSTYGSTCGTATASFVATTTATLFASTYIGSSTADIISWSDGSAGTFYQSHGSSSPFRLKNGDCFVLYSDQAGVTSTASWTTAGGFTSPTAYLYLNTQIR